MVACPSHDSSKSHTACVRWVARDEVETGGTGGYTGDGGSVGVYLSVERGRVGESGWEGRRQLRWVQRVWRPHVWAAGIESRHCELICEKKKRRSAVRWATSGWAGGAGWQRWGWGDGRGATWVTIWSSFLKLRGKPLDVVIYQCWVERRVTVHSGTR